jgi:hypothetical protein
VDRPDLSRAWRAAELKEETAVSHRQPSQTDPGPQEQEPAVERRRAPRYPCDLQTTCRPLAGRDGASWAARVVNISRSGIGLAVSRRFEPGALLTVELEDPRRTVSRSVLARVVHARPHADYGWLLGCAFSGELDDDELAAFRVERVRPAEGDCRAWVRFSCDVPTVCRDAADPEAAPVYVRVVDVAPGGVGLLGYEPWQQGTLLRLQLPGGPEGVEDSVLIRVVRSEAVEGGRWFVGGELADQLTDRDVDGLVG